MNRLHISLSRAQVNVLASLPKSVQPKVKSEMREIWLAEDRNSANKALDGMLAKYADKYPAAMKK
ncbi:transposase, partial [Salmonella enterica]|nr:hypothetical protein [Salmonella enterica]EIW3446893.1 transposase [Salmonella enterica]